MKSQKELFRLSLSFLVLFTLFVGTVGSKAWADDIYTILVKKQEEKEKTRWSLSDWFETRDRMRIQDLWLSLHSPSPYEYYLGGNYQFDQSIPGSEYNAGEAFFAAYAGPFGLEAHYESGLNKIWLALFNMRIFGFHDQATNIILQVGVRDDVTDVSYRNGLAGVSMTLYLAKTFGVEGYYRHFFPSTPTVTGATVSGDRFQGGAFLDFQFLRVYGDYFSDVETSVAKSGIQLGTRLYF